MNHPLKPTIKDSKRCLKKHKKLLSRIRATVRTTCYNLMTGIDGTQAASCALCKLANRFHLSTHGANSSHPFTVNQFNSTLHVYCTYQVAVNSNETEKAPCNGDLSCERDSGEKAGERDVPNRRRPGSPHSHSGLVTPAAPVALVAPPLPVPTLQLPRLRRLLPRLPRKPEQEELKKQIKDYLAKGMIEPSSSPYAAPILFVQKKSGELRMCIDYRQLNKLTLRDQYPLPRIDDLFDRLSGCSVFSSLDLQAGYHQIRITPEDVPKTAFRTPEGHFQFKVLSFGLTNAPATFQRVMNDAFAPVLGKCALVYLDDILVMSKSLPDHMQHLRLVFDLLRANKLFAKMSKCEFMQLTLKFLGHVISAGAMSVDLDKASILKPGGLLNPLSIPDYRWESVSMDFITKLPSGSHGYDAICVFVDRLSKMVTLCPAVKT
ncbi:hypothetical protein QJQ45_010210 [Haematococcus lacustris]|nr:hypothetical protein QJQ45_010210 [Haematococcus lacustris]